MKLIYLEWEDATASHGWHDAGSVEEFMNDYNSLIKQVGWVYAENKKYLVLASRIGLGIFGEDGTSPDELSYGNLQKIPKTWVRRRIELTEAVRDVV